MREGTRPYEVVRSERHQIGRIAVIRDTIVINDDIYITIFETSPVGNKFKVAIDAPKEMKISRGEHYADDPERWAKIEAMKAESMRRSRKALEAEKAKQ